MRVRDVMRREVITVNRETPARDAYALMLAGEMRHLPVLDADGELVGIVSERDLRSAGEMFKNPESGTSEFLITRDVDVDALMVANPVCVSPETSIPRASRIIRDRRIGCVLVTEGGRLVGILSYLDILDAAIVEHEQPPARGPGDTQPLPRTELESLRKQLEEELSQFRLENPTPAEDPVAMRKHASYLSAGMKEREENERRRVEDDSRLMEEIASQLKKK